MKYSTIQEAINASVDGNTILVKPGVYHENLYIDKSIKLITDNYSAMIIGESKEVGSTIRIVARKASIIGFTIVGGSTGVFLHGKKLSC
jgi:pectin methylesterase-like acyl-CoA thioesterase